MHASISDLACPYAVSNGGKFLLEFFECTSRRMGTVGSVHTITCFSSQFDKVCHKMLLWELYSHGVTGEGLLWIRNLFSVSDEERDKKFEFS